ncbi:MAG TPA: UDP-N-acetylmuramate dehydrogenase [Streptosporangiaceae bacterium]|nr:UDP-N-acetylmuramate dehydrogenase [Streptosporangiaceae bacterium]
MLRLREQADLAGYTTLRLGGPAARLIEADTAADLVAVVRDADLAEEPLLVLGGGSNLVIADVGFGGTVVRVATAGVAVDQADEQVRVTVAAGENWDLLVEWAVGEKLAGIECLAGIPGLAGSTPIQNVGAYGQEVAATISAVRAFDRARSSVVTLDPPGYEFGYRTSIFKTRRYGSGESGLTGRFVVLDVTFTLARDPMSLPIKYPELAAKLGVEVGEQAPLTDVREAVLALRRGKGMVLDPADPDTVSVGSFFINPVLDRAQLAELERRGCLRSPGIEVPTFPADDGRVKVSAAWLIEQAGFGKGYQGPGGARISTKHTLALTNYDGATTADLIGLARQVVVGVRDAFGVELTNESVLVGVQL